jgi:hypothetical protein
MDVVLNDMQKARPTSRLSEKLSNNKRHGIRKRTGPCESADRLDISKSRPARWAAW